MGKKKGVNNEDSTEFVFTDVSSVQPEGTDRVMPLQALTASGPLLSYDEVYHSYNYDDLDSDFGSKTTEFNQFAAEMESSGSLPTSKSRYDLAGVAAVAEIAQKKRKKCIKTTKKKKKGLFPSLQGTLPKSQWYLTLKKIDSYTAEKDVFEWEENDDVVDTAKPSLLQDVVQDVYEEDPLLQSETPLMSVLPNVAEKEKSDTRRRALPFTPVSPSHLNWREFSLPPPSSYPPTARLEDFALIDDAAPSSIRYLRFNGQDPSSDHHFTLSSSERKFFGQKISEFQRLEILILQNMGLEVVDDISLPALKYADFSHNNIMEIRSLVGFARNSPLLEQLTIFGNPVQAKVYWHYHVIAAVDNIKMLNGEPVALRDRIYAYEAYGGRAKNTHLPELAFDLALCEYCEKNGLLSWEPAKLTTLSVAHLGLKAIFVGTLTSLTTLDASHNQLNTLEYCGLEQCGALTSLDLSHNDLKLTKKQLSRFGLLSSLLHINLAQNKFTKYRLPLLYHTRNLCGTPTCPGLDSIDNQEVSVDERVRALKVFGKLNAGECESERFTFALYHAYSFVKISTIPQFLQKVTVLHLSDCGLRLADLNDMPHLQVVNLEYNDLRTVKGLTTLPHLKVLCLYGNPKLSLTLVLHHLEESKCAALQQFWYSAPYALSAKEPHRPDDVDPLASPPEPAPPEQAQGEEDQQEEEEEEEYMSYVSPALARLRTSSDRTSRQGPVSTRHVTHTATTTVEMSSSRQPIIESLCTVSPVLYLVDGVLVSMQERARAYDARQSTSLEDSQKYRFHIACLSSVYRPSRRLYDPQQLAPGRQYNPLAIFRLIATRRMNLLDRHLSLLPFTNIHTLDLSHNQIESVERLQLGVLKHLRFLNLSYNAIISPLGSIASVIDSLPLLEVVMLAGNPSMATAGARRSLLAAVARLQHPHCLLRVLDTPITLKERMAVWRSAHPDGDAELFKSEFAVFTRIENQRDRSHDLPQTVDPLSVRAANLSHLQLTRIDLTAYPRLKALMLRDNNFTDLKMIEGLEHRFPELEVLDLRDNRLDSLDQLASVLSSLPKLQAVGIAGNAFRGEAGKHGLTPRQSLINRLFPVLREVYTSALIAIDDAPINVEELILAYKSWEGEKTKQFDDFRMTMALRQAIPLSQLPHPETVTELDLSSSSLRILGLSHFQNLKRLVLRDNSLDDDTIPYIQNTFAHTLQLLDVSNNKLRSLDLLATLAETMPLLTSLTITGNPCFKKETPDARVRFLSSLPHMLAPGAHLAMLNGVFVTLEERCAVAVSARMSAEDVSVLRCRLCLEEIVARPESLALSLQNNQLVHLSPLADFKALTFLDLSHNSITTLDGSGLSTLPALEILDLRHNQFASPTTLLASLTQFSALRSLYLQHAVPGKLSRVHVYAPSIFKCLPALQFVDGVSNPNPLSAKEMIAAAYLKSQCGVSFNSVHAINIANRNFPADLFQSVVQALSFLPVHSLDAAGNLWEKLPNYRFRLIYHVPQLKIIDGKRVSTDERGNARVVFANMSNTKRDAFDRAQRATTAATAGYVLAEADQDRTQDRATEGGPSHTQQNLEQLDAGADFVFSVPEEEGEDVGRALAEETLPPTGAMLNKAEIIINYFQVFSLLYAFLPSKRWPQLWLDLTIWFYSFNIDLDVIFDYGIPEEWQYIRFALTMLIPPLIYYYYRKRVHQSNFERKFLKEFGKTKRRWLVQFFTVTAVVFFLAVIVTLPSSSSFPSPLALILILLGLVPFYLHLFFRCIVARRYIKRHNLPGFWFNFLKAKKRGALFALSVLYTPLARVILFNFKCVDDDNGVSVIEPFPEEKCDLSEPGNYPTIQWISLLAALLYIVGIPLFLSQLIRRGVGEVDACYRVKQDYDDLQKEKSALKSSGMAPEATRASLQQWKEKMVALKYKYAKVSKEFKSPVAYLYNAFQRKFRYYKLVIMLQKLVLLSISIFYGFGVFKVALGTSVLFLISFLTIVLQPFSDQLEDVMEILSLVANSVNMFIAFLIMNDNISEDDDSVSTILIVVNVAALGGMVLFFFIHPIRKRILRRRAARQKALSHYQREIELSQLQDRQFRRQFETNSPELLSHELTSVAPRSRTVGSQGLV